MKVGDKVVVFFTQVYPFLATVESISDGFVGVYTDECHYHFQLDDSILSVEEARPRLRECAARCAEILAQIG